MSSPGEPLTVLIIRSGGGSLNLEQAAFHPSHQCDHGHMRHADAASVDSSPRTSVLHKKRERPQGWQLYLTVFHFQRVYDPEALFWREVACLYIQAREQKKRKYVVRYIPVPQRLTAVL